MAQINIKGNNQRVSMPATAVNDEPPLLVEKETPSFVQLVRDNAIEKRQRQINNRAQAVQTAEQADRATKNPNKRVNNIGRGNGRTDQVLNKTNYGANTDVLARAREFGQLNKALKQTDTDSVSETENGFEEKKRLLQREKFERQKQQIKLAHLEVQRKDSALAAVSRGRLSLAFKALYTVIGFLPAFVYLHLHAFLHAIGFKKTFTKMTTMQKVQFGIATAIFGAVILSVFVMIYYWTNTSAWQKAKDAAGIIIE